MEGWGLKFWAWGGIAALESKEMSLEWTEQQGDVPGVNWAARGRGSSKKVIEKGFINIIIRGEILSFKLETDGLE